MKQHIVIQILEDMGITSEEDAISVVGSLQTSDINPIIDRMENWYAANTSKILEPKKNSIFDYWIPSATADSLYNVTANLLLADSVVMEDPLYDYLCYLDGSAATQWILQGFKGTNRHICDECTKKILDLENVALKRKIADILTFYLRSKPIIAQGLLIPYVDVFSMYYNEENAWVDLSSKYDVDAKNFYRWAKRATTNLNKYSVLSEHLVNESTLPIFDEWIRLEHIKRPAIAGVQDFLRNHSVSSPSIDFLNSLSVGLFRGLVKYLKSRIKEVDTTEIMYPDISNYITIPSLQGLSPDMLLEILDDRKIALSQFKEFLVAKTTEISSPVGSDDWRSQVNSIRAMMRKDLFQLDQEMKDVKSNHIKRQAENLSLVGLSVGMASLAVSGQNLDLVSVLQGAASGAALSSGIKSIIDSWLDYQEKVNEHKRRDVYFLWSLGGKNRG